MTYSVNQPWDPLKVCAVGRSYPPEFYSFMKSPKLRNLFERIATETEEDFQNIIKKLKEFNVDIVRPQMPTTWDENFVFEGKKIPPPYSMVPRDQMIMIGENFFIFPFENVAKKHFYGGNKVEKNQVESLKEYESYLKNHYELRRLGWWNPIVDKVKEAGNKVIENTYNDILDGIPANGITRCGKDLIFGLPVGREKQREIELLANKFFNDYKCHYITTGGHIDGCFSPIKPGLIVSINEIPKEDYTKTFNAWEVVYLEGESWFKVKNWLDLKHKNQGKWWIKGYEQDDEVIDYVETWLSDWTGYAEESVFDVNILTIDENNIMCTNYNKEAFDAFERHNITPHIVPYRHRYFWDGGIHCVTADLHREGELKSIL